MYKKYNYAQVKAIEAKNKDILLNLNPKLNDKAGIYFLTRVDEDGIKYAYVGQARHIITRLCQHMVGYQHIDLSIRKHGLKSDSNPYGWSAHAINCMESKLDELERYYILQYAEKGFQLRNKTAGGQDAGKKQIDEYRPKKKYKDGLEQGYRNASRDMAHLFDLHLNVTTKNDPPTIYQEKALKRFEEFLEHYKGK